MSENDTLDTQKEKEPEEPGKKGAEYYLKNFTPRTAPLNFKNESMIGIAETYTKVAKDIMLEGKELTPILNILGEMDGKPHVYQFVLNEVMESLENKQEFCRQAPDIMRRTRAKAYFLLNESWMFHPDDISIKQYDEQGMEKVDDRFTALIVAMGCIEDDGTYSNDVLMIPFIEGVFYDPIGVPEGGEVDGLLTNLFVAPENRLLVYTDDDISKVVKQ